MSVSAMQVLRSGTLAGLMTAVAAAIALGQQPLGQPFWVTADGSPYWAQTMTTGTVENSNLNTSLNVVTTDIITVTSGQLLALNATPKALKASPGAGKALLPAWIEVFMDYNSAAYAGIASGKDLTVKYTNGSGAVLGTIETTGFLDQTSDQRRILVFSGEITPVADAALVLHLASGEVTTGNSALQARLGYREITLIP